MENQGLRKKWLTDELFLSIARQTPQDTPFQIADPHSGSSPRKAELRRELAEVELLHETGRLRSRDPDRRRSGGDVAASLDKRFTPGFVFDVCGCCDPRTRHR